MTTTSHQYHEIHRLYEVKGRSVAQIADELKLNPKTVRKWLGTSKYQGRKNRGRSSLLDPFKNEIQTLLDQYPDYTGRQILHFIREEGYTGSYTLVKDYLRLHRPKKKRAFNTLHFPPGDCAQVDWGNYKSVEVANTRRRLSVFSMVMSHSRKMYIEFTVSENQENFLQCHQNAFEYFGGVPKRIMVDNCKTAVLHNHKGSETIYNPWYLDFAKYYGFQPEACNVRSPHEKGQVESSINYIKKSLLNRPELPRFEEINIVGRDWLERIANERTHETTGKKPTLHFDQADLPVLTPLPIHPYQACRIVTRRASPQFRIQYDGNKYSVPAKYRNDKLDIHAYAHQILVYHKGDLISEHQRVYGRKYDQEHPEHRQEFINQKKREEDQLHYRRFLQLSPNAELFYQRMTQRNLRPKVHIQKILALCKIYSEAEVKRALEDAAEYEIFNATMIEHLLEQRRSYDPHQPEPLHVPCAEDALKIQTPANNLDQYKITQ